MAEQIAYDVTASLVNRLASLAFDEIASMYGVESDIEWLKETVGDIKAVLADADQKKNADHLIQRWIEKLNQVLYEADDLLDEVHARHLVHMRDSKGKVREFFSCTNPLPFRYKIARKIRNIREMFNEVAERMSKLNFNPSVAVEVKQDTSRNWRETCSFVAQEEIIGREGNKKDIIGLLLNRINNDGENCNQNVSLVAIVGIGGLGKTALAQLVYNDVEVERFFKKRIWVCVSENFDVKALLKHILESLLGKKEDDQPLELLQNKLRQNLDGHKYLLVLDDVWNEDEEKWLALKHYLMCGAEGSKILVTTRSQMVVNKMGVKMPYLLKGLENDQSWALLKRRAFDEGQIVNQKLEDIGRKIAERCAGVPLAIRVMGSLLQFKSRESEWEAILKGDFWKLCEDNDSIMPILKLSYDSLTIELKQCFEYCSLYPKDYEYEKEELIDLWMAQGFLGDKDEGRCQEDIGEDYVHILLMKSFLQDVETDESGEIKYFKMHDLMHDLSYSIARSYCYVHGRKNIAKFPMHASFEYYNHADSSSILGPKSRLRTFLEIKKNNGRNPCDLLVLKRLRSLDLSGYTMSDLPESIGKMSHLRYLNLSHCRELTSLPKSIVKLVHLETLILQGCINLKFPVDIITKLINLRKLEIYGWREAFEDGMPLGLCKMTNLQSLPYFIVGNEDKGRKKAKLNELKELNLKGELTIKNLGLVREVVESKDVNLRGKENLVSLTLDWGQHSEVGNCDAVQLLGNLCPHQNLKTLSIVSYPGVCLSNWLLSCTNLVQLNLFSINNCGYLAAGLEGLVFLKTLRIWGMEKLECIYYKGYSSSCTFFPSLEQLYIRGCESLRGWENVEDTSDHGHHHSLPQFSRLSSLSIYGCPNLTSFPTFLNLVSKLRLWKTSTKALADTLKVNVNVGRNEASTSHHHITPSLSMLKELCISEMDMEALPEGWVRNLSSLHTIEIDRWHQLEALPEWICDLRNLRSIYISFCPKLVSFPEGMCRLTNLQTLHLIDPTPLLKERCEREKGAEWPKIAHIPLIRIGGTQI